MSHTQFLIMYFGFGLAATIFELVRPARKLNYWAKDALLLDIAAWFFTMYVVDRYANFIRYTVIPFEFRPSHFLLSIPLPIRIFIYYVIGDCSTYWVHRMNHTKHMWRVHHFHHSITQMHWLSGVRDTVFQQLGSNLPYVLWAPLLAGAPSSVFIALTFIGVFTNHWMHMNVTWRSNWLEYVFVTPRSHLIHHSSATEHYNKNFGVVLSVWDRLFGTWLSPDTTTVEEVGAGKLENPVEAAWLMLGIFRIETFYALRARVQRCIAYLRRPRTTST